MRRKRDLLSGLFCENMDKQLSTFLAREFDGRSNDCQGGGPDDNMWALLADGLISPHQREELLQHTETCSQCRQRMSAIVAEWDDDVQIAGGEPAALADEVAGVPWLFSLKPSRYALAAGLVIVAGLGIYFGGERGSGSPDYGVDLALLVSADSPLTDLGVDLRQRTVRADVVPAMGEAEYRATIGKLQEELGKKDPSMDAQAIATRVALSARFFEDAVVYAEAWRREAQGAPEAQNAFGLACYQLNRFDEALPAFERAVGLAPDRMEYRLNAALAADQADQIDAARQHLLELQKLAPNYPGMDEIDRWLRQLDP